MIYDGEPDYDFKEDKFLLGSRVFTDHGICRHTASLLNDINNEYGFDSINLLVKITNKNSIFLKAAEYTSMDYSDHLVVGINTKDGKFIFICILIFNSKSKIIWINITINKSFYLEIIY